MFETKVNEIVRDFCAETHGSTDLDEEVIFVKGEGESDFAPLKFLTKHIEGLSDEMVLLKEGYVVDSLDFLHVTEFPNWFEEQFGRKLERSKEREIFICHRPKDKIIFDSIEQIHACYEVLRKQKIIMNSKNLPIQLGEWFAKTIFGMRQKKTQSQRGFDFFIGDESVEVAVDWGDVSSPKGVKIKKSLVELSDHCVIIYIAKNFMIREICVLDSEFVLRKFENKGHTLFLKDSDISQYFFSNSSRHLDKVVNRSALMRYSCPTLAMKLAEFFDKH